LFFQKKKQFYIIISIRVMKKTQFKISNKISLVVLYSIMINIYKPKDDLRHYVI
jgi:hypothetical protein